MESNKKSNSLLSVDERVLRLESRLQPCLPGTQIERVMGKERGFEWCIGLGLMNERKMFFYGDTIDQALNAAEAEIFKVYPAEKLKVEKSKKDKGPLWLFNGILATIE